MEIDPTLASTLSTSLFNILAKNSSEYVATKISEAKIKTAQSEKDVIYTDLIYGLLDDKNRLSNIAQDYKRLYESVTITEEDIDSLQKTISNSIELISEFTELTEQQQESIKLFTDLLNKDTLKTIQLLGFNYKKAIGEPLTDSLSSFITRKLNPKSNSSISKSRSLKNGKSR